MKRYASLLIAFALVLAALLLGGCGIINGLEYELIDDSYYEVSGISNREQTKITIPARYKGLPVKSIGNYAFFYCSSLTNITFTGTQAQWNSISKGTDWKSDYVYVVCTG